MKEQFKVKLTTKNITYMAMFMALQIVLEYVDKLWPSMPQGGALSISLTAIFLCSYLMGVGYGVLVGIGSCLLQFALGLASYWGVWSVLFDYLLPLAVCGLAPLVKSIKIGDKFIFHIGILFAIFLKFLSHFYSGAIIFGSYAGDTNPFVYSFLYNAPYNFISGIVCLVIFSVLYPRIKIAFRK